MSEFDKNTLFTWLDEYFEVKQEKEKEELKKKILTSTKYPNQIGSAKRPKKTLGVDAFLSRPKYEDGQPPLEMHAGYSRFVYTIIDKSEAQPKTVTANIPAKDARLIKKRTDTIISYNIVKQFEATAELNEPAYTVKLVTSEFSGKTAAQVLLENSANKEKLIKTKEWLQANLSKYPRNKEQIDAIDDALDKFDLGILESNSSASNVVEIYNSEIKIPNSSKLNKDGKTFVYTISILYDPAKKLPYAINITNCYAKPHVSPTGQITVEMQSADNNLKLSMLLSESEWSAIVDSMFEQVQLANGSNYNELNEVMHLQSFFK